MSDLATLKRKRASLKANLTRFINFFDSIDNSESLEEILVELGIRLAKIEDLLSQFLDIQLDIEALDDNFDFLETDNFEKAFYSVVAKAKQFISLKSIPVVNNSNHSSEHNESNSNSSSQRHSGDGSAIRNNVRVKLPVIELPKFAGQYEKWLEFRDLYLSLIHNCTELEPIQKFHYLRASLEGSAAQCIKSMEFTATNYELAWKILVERFENKQLIVHNHIKSLFSISEVKAESASAFRDLVDTISKNLRALNSLGISTNQWDPLIIFMITSKLDSDTMRDWERQSFEHDLPTLDELKSFLSARADFLEKLNVRKGKPENRLKPHKTFVASSNPSKSFSCYICNQPHSIYKCQQFLALPIHKRREKVSNLKLCSNCLRGSHSLSNCSSGHCKYCSERHHSLLHETSRSTSRTEQHEARPSVSTERTTTSCSYSSTSQVLLSTVQVQVLDSSGNFHTCKALLDNASMSNFISQGFANKLGIPQRQIQWSVVGIGQTLSDLHFACNIQIKSSHFNFTKDLSCLIIPSITDQLPSIPFDPSSLKIPSHLRLADPSFHQPGEIDLLIGADTFWQVMSKGTIFLGKNKPVAQKTKLGWIISGSLGNRNSDTRSICNFSANVDIQKQLSKFWEIEEVSSQQILSEEQHLAEQHFTNTSRRDPSGRFIVSIPLKDSIAKLGDSREGARRQFFNLERRLCSNPKLKELYTDFMSEYIHLSHMSRYEPSEDEITYFAPHHGVLKEDSITTKLRVVFNCSAPSSSGYSYNNLQMVGPTIQEDLVSITLRFRARTYVVTADICKMFRQIKVSESFKPLQLIFWRPNPWDELLIYSLDTVTYGTVSAPYLSTRCLKQLAIEHKHSFPIASEAIDRDFYMDDLLSGADSTSELIELCQQVSSILKSGCFELRKWRSNSRQVLEGIKESISSSDAFHFGPTDSSKTLGLFWSSSDDTFSFKILLDPEVKRVTKRTVLSQIMRIFDPIGLISPVVVTAKLLLQSLWLLKLSWDQVLPDNLLHKWLSFRKELSELNSLKIARHVSCPSPILIQLHGFADASQRAYGACIYVRTVDSERQVHTHLLCSKTRVAPLKCVTIPRLELFAALLLSQLYQKVKDSMTLKFDRYFLWSDSTVVLAWIRSSPHNLQTLVANRVAEIQRLTEVQNWRYVPTSSNPADILSRGLYPKQLIDSPNLWFFGPSWLLLSPSDWPQDISLQNQISLENLPEVRKGTQTLVQVDESKLFPFNKFAKLVRLKRVFAYCLRFINNIRKANEQRSFGSLSHEELHESLNLLVGLSQRESFPNECIALSKGQSISNKSKLISLTPFLDHNIIRVGGRLRNSSYPFPKKHPAVLSSKHHLTKLIFTHLHNELLHCGPQFLLAAVREKFWAVSGKNLAKKVTRSCILCFKFKPKGLTPIMGNLPEPRVVPRAPFSDTGVDYAGPFFIKSSKGRGSRSSKCYLCLFICLTTKAIHLELVTELSTYAFLEAFQRFISRRGKPAHMYSDNGRNFVGANNHLREFGKFLKSNKDVITDEVETKHSIQWHFIAAYSPHQGGLWEAGVKSAKHHIKRVLSNALLTFENFYTVLTRIEGILNSRPLTQLSTDPNDLEVLTPAHFLIGRSMQSLPHPDLSNVPSNRLNHFQQLEQLKQHFWSRWSKEYISQLQERTKWKTNQVNIAVGSLVLIRDDNLPSFRWHLGRISSLHPGADGVVRVASVTTKSGVVKRAVVKLCPLPIDGLQNN